MTSRTWLALVPFALTGLIYRWMGLLPHWGLEPWRVHVCDLRAFDLAWFGSAGTNVGANDWLQAHSSLALDVFCAIPYATYLAASVAFALWLAQGNEKRRGLALRFGWGFLMLNVAGFITYHLYPAAPPWYYHAHGCFVDVAAGPSTGPNLARVDALLGISLFGKLYHQSSWVFGAMPSLHVAYPLLMLLTGWSIHGAFGRAALGAYWLWMCFSAVYLDHHWVVDVVVGSVYAVAVFVAVAALARVGWRTVPERSVP